jgi:hypothetical protein
MVMPMPMPMPMPMTVAVAVCTLAKPMTRSITHAVTVLVIVAELQVNAHGS